MEEFEFCDKLWSKYTIQREFQSGNRQLVSIHWEYSVANITQGSMRSFI